MVVTAEIPAAAPERALVLDRIVDPILALAALNSFGLIPAVLADVAADLSRWCLLVAIAAVGIKTSLAKMLEVGPTAIALLVLETVFLGAWVLIGLNFLG